MSKPNWVYIFVPIPLVADGITASSSMQCVHNRHAKKYGFSRKWWTQLDKGFPKVSPNGNFRIEKREIVRTPRTEKFSHPSGTPLNKFNQYTKNRSEGEGDE
jgi:hypothetical protein